MATVGHGGKAGSKSKKRASEFMCLRDGKRAHALLQTLKYVIRWWLLVEHVLAWSSFAGSSARLPFLLVAYA